MRILQNFSAKCHFALKLLLLYFYYSVSAQSSFAIGAILNATFGSGVELILYVVLMIKGINDDSLCYNELVRSGLSGTFL